MQCSCRISISRPEHLVAQTDCAQRTARARGRDGCQPRCRPTAARAVSCSTNELVLYLISHADQAGVTSTADVRWGPGSGTARSPSPCRSVDPRGGGGSGAHAALSPGTAPGRGQSRCPEGPSPPLGQTSRMGQHPTCGPLQPGRYGVPAAFSGWAPPPAPAARSLACPRWAFCTARLDTGPRHPGRLCLTPPDCDGLPHSSSPAVV